MELTGQIAAIQGVLISSQNKEGSLRELSLKTKDDNTKIQNVVQALKNVIYGNSSKRGEEDDPLRKCTFFLILNTASSAQEFLKDDLNCGHLVECAPTLSKDVLVEIVWDFSLLKYLCEAVVLCPSFLSLELLSIVKNKIAILPPSAAMSSAAELAKAVYVKIIRVEMDSSVYDTTHEVNCVLSKLLEHFQIFLKHVTKPPTMNVATMTEVQLYDQAGVMINTILLLVISCLDYYAKLIKQSKIYTDDVLDIYCINVKYDYSKWTVSENFTRDNLISVLNNALFAMCVENISSITCDLWMHFVECDSTRGSERTLQKEIGENMYLVMENINSVKELGVESPHFKDLIPILKSMAMKPRDEDDEIREADLKTILLNVSNSEKSRNKWFKALFQFKEVFSDEQCIECMRSNMSLMSYDEVDIIFKHLFSHDTNSDLKYLALDALQSLPLRSQLELMNICLTKFNINPVLCTDNFNTELIETFNKAVNSESSLQDKFYSNFIRLSIQNPQEIVKKILLEALSSHQQCLLMVSVLKTLWPLKLLSLKQPCQAGNVVDEERTWNVILSSLYQVMVEHVFTTSEQDMSIYLIITLVNDGVVDPDEFLNLGPFSSLHSRLQSRDYESVDMWLSVLQLFVDGSVKEVTSLNNPSLLVLLAEIIRSCSKDPFDFSPKALTVYEHALDLVDIVLPKYLSQKLVQDSHITWLQKELVRILSPKHLFYFLPLWHHFGQEPPMSRLGFPKLLHADRLKLSGETLSKDKICLMLFRNIATCTSKEWLTISRNMLPVVEENSVAGETKASHVFLCLLGSMLSTCILFLPPHQLEPLLDDLAPCMDHCIRSFSLCAMELIRAEPISPAAGSEMFTKCIQMYNLAPDPVRSTCSGIIMNILIEIVTTMKKSGSALNSHPKVQLLVTSIATIEDKIAKKRLAAKVSAILN